MKRTISAFLLLLLLMVSLTACGGENEAVNTNPVVSPSAEATAAKAPEPTEPSASAPSTPDVSEPQNESIFPDGVTYMEEYALEGDPGDGLSAPDSALLLLNADPDYMGDPGETTSITLYGLEYVGDGECYLFRVEDEYGAVARYAVDYGTGGIYVYYEESGEYLIMDVAFGSDPGDTNIPNWWGEYIGDGFSILINNFDGDSFSFAVSNLQNGEYIFEGVAAIDPDDDHLAVYGDVEFYLYEDIGAIDFLTSESGEWAHLRGQYKQG